MLEAQLLQRIEKNWDRIAEQVIAQRNRDPKLQHYRSLSDNEIKKRAQDFAANLAQWLHDRDELKLGEHYERLGGERFKHGIPLAEVIHKITIIKQAFRTYALDHNPSLTPIEIYAELELIRTMAGFFDFVIYRVARGYEDALRRELDALPPVAKRMAV
jgi:hypothetical protein